MVKIAAATASFLSVSLAVANGKQIFTRRDLPKGKEWHNFEDGTGFMNMADVELTEHMRRNFHKQRRNHDNNHNHNKRGRTLDQQNTSNTHYRDYFVDGSETFWPEGSQAWRLIGYYIDCYDVETGYKDRRHAARKLPEDEEIESNACLRYLLWAAYIDIYYEGGGIGEYMFWNASSNSWDTSACEEVAESGEERCVKMDCHLQGSDHFRLLGFFKEPNFAQFYEQLFKHQGICIWDGDEYEFMQNMRQSWPQACTSSGVQDENSNTLYFDMKPTDGADVSLGLYTDEQCSNDYQGKLNILEVIDSYEKYGNGEENGSGDNNNNGDGSLLNLVAYMDTWNSAMEVYKQCQPCKAYNLNYEYVDSDDDGNGYNYNYNYDDDRDGDEDDYSDDDSNGHFKCEDDAGYTNVNQCMKFATHTKMMAATFRDIMIGASQGTINDVFVGKIAVHAGAYIVPGTNWEATDFLRIGMSTLFLLGSAYTLYVTVRRRKEWTSTMNQFKQPLVVQGETTPTTTTAKTAEPPVVSTGVVA